MALNFNLSSPNSHALSSATDITALPLTLVMWVTSAGGQTRRFLWIGDTGDSTQIYSLNLNISSASNLVSAYVTGNTGGSSANQALSTSAIDTTTGHWNHVGAIFSASNARSAYLNGVNKGNSTGAQTAPTGLNAIVISGRPWDYAFSVNGMGAHAALYNRAITDDEMAYIGAGGNPRAIKGLAHYYVCYGTETATISDRAGSSTYDLTVTNCTAGSSDPDVAPYATGTVGAQSWTTGTAIGQIDLSTSGSIVENPGNAYTATLQQLSGSAAVTTTTSGTGTTQRQVALASAASVTAGMYCSVNSGTKTRVLYVNGSSNTVTVAADQTYTAGQSVSFYSGSPITISGIGISANKVNGTPSATGTYTNTFFRLTNNNNSVLHLDTELVTITIASGGGGGGGGSGLINASSGMSGGFQG